MIRLYHGSNVKIEVPDRTCIKAIEETMTTKLTSEQKQLLKDELSVEIAGFLVDDYKYSPEEAIDVLYTSETFDRLQDDATGLYYQSPGYVYSFLQNELKSARVI